MLLAFSPEERGNIFGRAATATTGYKEDLRHWMVGLVVTRMVFAGLRLRRNNPSFLAVSKSARFLKVSMVAWG